MRLAPPAAEDEIDWDEDDTTKPTTEPAAAAVAAGGLGQVANPTAVPNQKVDIDPAKTDDLTVAGAAIEAPAAKESATPAPDAPATKAAPEPEAPKQDFSLGIEQTDAEKEAEKRAARAKRFGLPEDTEEQKKLARAKKFGTDGAAVVGGLDAALPERRERKRGREGGDRGGRPAKRQTTDRRGAKPTGVQKKSGGRITDDPAEKAKAEARAKKFGAVA